MKHVLSLLEISFVYCLLTKLNSCKFYLFICFFILTDQMKKVRPQEFDWLTAIMLYSKRQQPDWSHLRTHFLLLVMGFWDSHYPFYFLFFCKCYEDSLCITLRNCECVYLLWPEKLTFTHKLHMLNSDHCYALGCRVFGE